MGSNQHCTKLNFSIFETVIQLHAALIFLYHDYIVSVLADK